MAVHWATTCILATACGGWGPEAAQAAGMPPAPYGYTYLEHHAIGDSERNTRSNVDPPDNLTTKNGGSPPPCKGAEECLSVAQELCEKTEGCVSFGLANPQGNEDPATVASYQLFRAGLGNAYVNNDWYLYAKLKPCSSCPDGAFVQASAFASAASGAPAQTHACTTKGQLYPCGHPGTEGCTPELKDVQVYCDPDSSWGAAFLLVVALAGPGYVGAGAVLGGRQRGRAAALAVHPHYQTWLEVRSLVSDGISFTRARAQGRSTRPQQQRQEAARAPGSERLMTAATSDDEDRVRKRGSGEKKSRKEKKSRPKSGSPKAMDSAAISSERTEPPAATAATAAEPDTVSAPAGGGGRWVHVS